MVDLAKKYPSKLLLFGEHIVIKGANALAIPFPFFYGQWKYLGIHEPNSKQQSLAAYSDYLAKQLSETIDHQSFKQNINKGLYFESNIPTGYGAGSSGALVAAIFDNFSYPNIRQQPEELKKIFARMESYFHGSSSGTDPLVCYLNQPIFLTNNGQWNAVELSKKKADNKLTIFLLDTKKSRQTAPFVQIFLDNWEQENYRKIITKNLFPLNNAAIQELITGDWHTLAQSFAQISFWQWEYFKEMIPENLKYSWLFGLKSDIYQLKVCGAGGGGFMLGLTTDYAQTKELLADWSLTEIIW